MKTRQSYWLGLAWAWPAVEADLDLAMTASLCFALLAAVLPNRPGEGDRLLVLEMNIWARDGQMVSPFYYLLVTGRM